MSENKIFDIKGNLVVLPPIAAALVFLTAPSNSSGEWAPPKQARSSGRRLPY